MPVTTLTPHAGHSASTLTSIAAQSARVSQRIVSIRLSTLGSTRRQYRAFGGAAGAPVCCAGSGCDAISGEAVAIRARAKSDCLAMSYLLWTVILALHVGAPILASV